MENISVALCAIAKNENPYIREWVEWYKNLGVTKIFLYDNNDIDGEHFEDVINDYIQSGLVDIINVRGIDMEALVEDRLDLQDTCYIECYKQHKSEFTWMMFFDIDEFLYSPSNKNIIDYISSSKFDKFDTILVNWKYFGDCGNCYYENIPVVKRFPREEKKKEGITSGIRSKYQCKSIVRCGKIPETKFSNIHHKFLVGDCSVCNSNGIATNIGGCTIKNMCFGNLVLNHYITKTIEEYIKRYTNRTSKITQEKYKIQDVISNFFSFNEITKNKIDIIERYLNNIGVHITQKEIIKTIYNERNGYILMYKNDSEIIPDKTMVSGASYIPEISTYDNVNKIGVLMFGDKVSSICPHAFNNNNSLSYISLPDGITSIGENAFYNCQSLPFINIPSQVTYIGNSAFKNCTSFTYIACYSNVPPTCDVSCFENVNKSIPLYVPQDSINAYKNTNVWKDFTNILAIPGFQKLEIDKQLLSGITIDKQTPWNYVRK